MIGRKSSSYPQIGGPQYQAICFHPMIRQRSHEKQREPATSVYAPAIEHLRFRQFRFLFFHSCLNRTDGRLPRLNPNPHSPAIQGRLHSPKSKEELLVAFKTGDLCGQRHAQTQARSRTPSRVPLHRHSKHRRDQRRLQRSLQKRSIKQWKESLFFWRKQSLVLVCSFGAELCFRGGRFDASRQYFCLFCAGRKTG